MRLRLLLLAVISVLCAAAQTASWPTAPSTTANLLTAVNSCQSALLQPAAPQDTVLTLQSNSCIVPNSEVFIDANNQAFEAVKVLSINANLLTVVRGFDNTFPKQHLVRAVVANNIGAYYHNAMATEMIAVETWLASKLPANALYWQSQTADPS